MGSESLLGSQVKAGEEGPSVSRRKGVLPNAVFLMPLLLVKVACQVEMSQALNEGESQTLGMKLEVSRAVYLR